MKSYSVKSNAKRFARGIAAKHPENIEAIEPVETSISGMGWFPAIRVMGEVTDGFKVMVFDSYGADVVIHGMDTGEVVNESNDASRLKKAFDAVPPATTGDLEPFPAPTRKDGESPCGECHVSQGETCDVCGAVEPVTITKTAAVGISEANLAGMSQADLAEIAATLPPRVESSAEEIAARRAERRARIDAEKANPTPKPVKINKTKIILDLVKRKGGATQEELETATGWQRHTLRGFIAGTLRKRLAVVGMSIDCIRAKGEPTRYMVPMMEADWKEGDA